MPNSEVQDRILSGVSFSPAHIPLLDLRLGYMPQPYSPMLLCLPYQPLTSLYNDQLLLRGGSSKHNLRVVLEDVIKVL